MFLEDAMATHARIGTIDTAQGSRDRAEGYLIRCRWQHAVNTGKTSTFFR
jgi:hypothetical protein